MADDTDNNGGNGNGADPNIDLSSPEIGHGRDSRGQFVPGNKCGKGNPYLRRVAEYRQAIYKVLTPKNLEAAMATLVFLAVKKQDIAALKLVLEYSIGKPERFDLTSVTSDDIADRAAAIRDFLREARETIQADAN